MSNQLDFNHPDWRSLLTGSTKQETLAKRAENRRRMADVNRWLREQWAKEARHE